MEQVSGNAQTLAGVATDAAAPKRLHGAALAPWVAEAAVLLLRVSAVAILLSPALLAAAFAMR